MELVFDELSCQPYADDFTGCYSRIERFVKTYRVAETHGFRRIRFQAAFDQILLTDNCSLMEFCTDARARTLANIMLNIYRYPFIDDDSEEANRYIQNRFFIVRDGKRLPVHGLAAAYLYQTAGIGFYSDTYRDTILFSIEIEGDEKGYANIISVSKPEHFEEQVFIDWKEHRTEIRLVECNIPVENKAISLRDDHGKDVLLNFAKRLVRSPYVVAIVNSLPYNHAETKFIRKIKPDGTIEIVLIKTDEGLGLVVKTTGRNYKETKAIADILQAEYYK